MRDGAAGGLPLAAGPLRRVVALLGLTEITSWGALYYAFPVLASRIAADTGWPLTRLTAAFSLGLLVSAAVGIAVGRHLDRVGPRPVMTLGSALGPVALVAVASAASYPLFLAAWVLGGAAMAMLLYPPAFAALVRWGGERSTGALTALTLGAGLSSTVFAPLAHALGSSLGWRGAYIALAAVLLLVTLPAHALGLRHPWPGHRPPGGASSARPAPPVAVHRWSFLALAVTMTGVSLCVYAVVINLVPLLLSRGLTAGQAATTLAIGGVGQVAGRLAWGSLARRADTVQRTVVVSGTVAASTALLALAPPLLWTLWLASIVAGAARGAFTLVQATAVSDRWGTDRYGRLNGLLTAPVLVATAAAPWVGSQLAAGLGSQQAAFLLLAGVAALALALVPATRTGSAAPRGPVPAPLRPRPWSRRRPRRGRRG